MCDRFVFFRYMAKHYAAEEGLIATFMPKPFADKTGSGAHFNMSLFDRATGQNLFQCPERTTRADSVSAPSATSSVPVSSSTDLHCARPLPTVNSYKRLVRRGLMPYYSWAPVFNSYGNNRTNSLRVPMAGGRVESRNADAACNPYLAAALALAAGLEGIREQLDPGDPQEDNLYELSAAGSLREDPGVPRSLDEAVQALPPTPLSSKYSEPNCAPSLSATNLRRATVPPAYQPVGDRPVRAAILVILQRI